MSATVDSDTVRVDSEMPVDYEPSNSILVDSDTVRIDSATIRVD